MNEKFTSAYCPRCRCEMLFRAIGDFILVGQNYSILTMECLGTDCFYQIECKIPQPLTLVRRPL